jgi:hypothetical protein
MSSPVATASYARPYLSLLPDLDSIAAVVESTDLAAILHSPKGELQEWEGWAAPGMTLFRYVTPALALPVTENLPTRLLTPHVRGKLCDLIEALELEALRQAS